MLKLFIVEVEIGRRLHFERLNEFKDACIASNLTQHFDLQQQVGFTSNLLQSFKARFGEFRERTCHSRVTILCLFLSFVLSIRQREREREREREIQFFKSVFVHVNAGGPIHHVLLDNSLAPLRHFTLSVASFLFSPI